MGAWRTLDWILIVVVTICAVLTNLVDGSVRVWVHAFQVCVKNHCACQSFRMNIRQPKYRIGKSDENEIGMSRGAMLDLGCLNPS